jgi:DNA-binding transcriptional LysR family regulator
MKNLTGILAFVETARIGSITSASLKLDVTPAAVSKALSKLEVEIGVKLLQRTTRKLSLTDEGKVFLAKASAVLNDLSIAVDEISQSQQPVGNVRITTSTGFGRHWVLPALPSIRAQYPEVTVDADLENRQVDLVEGGYDIAIRGSMAQDSSMVMRRISALPTVLVASPQYLKKYGTPRKRGDLSMHQFASLRYGDRSFPSFRFKESARAKKQPIELWTPPIHLSTTDPDGLVELALGHCGIVQISLHHVAPFLRSGRLKILLPDIHDPGSREVFLLYPSRQFLAPRVRVVIDALLNHFASSLDLHLKPGDMRDYWA